MRQLGVFPTILGLCLSVGSAFGEEPRVLDDKVINERAVIAGRKELCKPKDGKTVFYEELTDLIIGATPLELGDRFASHLSQSGVDFQIDGDGVISNWKLTTLSGSTARDFWTLYAVATCPPVKTSGALDLPVKMHIENLRLPLVRSQEGEQQRLQLANSISRKIGARYVYFPLIPATFVDSFKGQIDIETVAGKENLVGISIAKLWNSVDGEPGTEVAKKDPELSAFLGEWSNFLKKEKNPSRSQIMKFASTLKDKYRNLLKEGEPEAPLP
ncbi:MAG: hypothetical protein C0508_10895 [Cyanobacteria bacterium PR.023]|jgi:hypothetical protein|nr:hypothetical protein [Cyanobacteria bacterium PR.023]